MFDFEQSISDWRRQMLAAGIKSPTPLEELEIHLREEIIRQMESGANSQAAFEISILMIGEPVKLKSEFTKIQVPTIWRIFSVLWFIGCLWSFDTASRQLASKPLLLDRQWFLINSLAYFIYAAGVFGSFLLFRGLKWGARIIRTIALLLLIACVAQILADFDEPLKWRIWCGACALFSTVTLWHLRPKRTNATERAQF